MLFHNRPLSGRRLSVLLEMPARFLDEILPVGLLDALPHGGAETAVLFEKAQGSNFHQPLDIHRRAVSRPRA